MSEKVTIADSTIKEYCLMEEFLFAMLKQKLCKKCDKECTNEEIMKNIIQSRNILRKETTYFCSKYI